MTERVFQDDDAVQFDFGIPRRSRAALGFLPAFFDFATATVYRSRFADGRLAPYYVLDGLPEPLVASRDLQGRVNQLFAGKADEVYFCVSGIPLRIKGAGIAGALPFPQD